MPAHRKTYRLAPNWGFPTDGAIALGNVIKDPKQPQRALLRDRPDDSLVTTTKQTNFVFSRDGASNASKGLFSSVIAPILGVDVAANTLKHENDTFKFQELETQYFGPSNEMIATRLYHPDVVDYTSNQSWKSVYIITGIKIARGATMKTAVGRSHSNDATDGIDGPSTSKPRRQTTLKQNETTQFGAPGGFVFAYQLLRLQPRESEKQTFDARPFDIGALLGEDIVAEQNKAALAEKLRNEWDILEDEATASSPEMAVEIEELDCRVILDSLVDDDSIK